jgi:NADH dehydrogenase FAD-containing subunit
MTGVSRFAIAQTAAKVVIVGGGAGGATAAHLLKKEAPKLDVTLIETNPIYSSSFFSNLYLGGFREIESLNHGYQGLRALGIKVVQGTATDVDTSGKKVKVGAGAWLTTSWCCRRASTSSSIPSRATRAMPRW